VSRVNHGQNQASKAYKVILALLAVLGKEAFHDQNQGSVKAVNVDKSEDFEPVELSAFIE